MDPELSPVYRYLGNPNDSSVDLRKNSGTSISEEISTIFSAIRQGNEEDAKRTWLHPEEDQRQQAEQGKKPYPIRSRVGSRKRRGEETTTMTRRELPSPSPITYAAERTTGNRGYRRQKKGNLS
ncbi:hypothetical protein TNCV_4974141 [Trichonephila clavipes]|uniref:Uncharacterized protein n=1 Tax=Trichonephila clavipes TaxID=2585209 RepID=A0A8X6VGJ8_TRICX|nr:hypothetical protein TNCV_4974141 [Trichonephila clavipes]